MNESALFAFYYERRFIHEERKFQAQEPGQVLPFDRVVTRQLLGSLALYMWHWPNDPLTALDPVEAKFLLGARAEAFLPFAFRMHFLRQSPSGHISFIHLKFRDFCVVPALQQALDDRSVRVQQSAVEVLAQLKEIGLPTLLQALNHSNGAVRDAVTSELHRLPDTSDPALSEALKQAMPSLLQALYSTKANIRWSAAALIARLDSDAMPVLLPALQASDAAIRYTAASTLAHLDIYTDPAFPEALALSVPILLEGLNNFWRRSASALAHLAEQTDMRLYRKYDRSAPSNHPIIEAANHGDAGETGSVSVQKDPQIVRRIREILRPSVPVLVEALKLTDDPLRHEVRSALSHVREYLLPDLLPALRHSDQNVRASALTLLEGSERQAEPVAQEALMRFVSEALRDLQSGETARRRGAIWDILHLVPLIEQPDAGLREKLKQIMPALFEALQDRQEETRSEAAAALLELDVSVVPDLLQALENSDANVRRQAISRLALLARYGEPRFKGTRDGLEITYALLPALPALLQVLNDRGARVEEAIISLCTQLIEIVDVMGPQVLLDVTPALRQALRHQNAGVQCAAVFLFLKLGDQADPVLQEAHPQVVPALLKAIRSRDSEVQSNAFSSLLNLAEKAGSPYREALLQAMPILLRSLNAKSDDTQFVTLIAIARLGTQIMPVIRQALQHRDAKVRCMAVSVLSKIGSDSTDRKAFEQVLPDLLNALQDREAKVRENAIDALFRAGEQAFPFLRQALGNTNRRVKEALRIGFMYLGKPGVPVLLEALQDNDVVVRRNAASILGEYGLHIERESDHRQSETLTQAEVILLQALRDRDSRVREAVARALCRTGDQINASLLEMLKTPELQLRQSAAKILGTRRTVIPTLLRLLQSDDLATRWAALAALYEHGYVPKLEMRPRLHVTLHHTLGSSGSKVGHVLLRLQMRASFLHGIPIHNREV